MNRAVRGGLAGLVWVGLTLTSALGQPADPSLVAVVADGKPWSMVGPDDQPGTLTLSPGGSGVMTMGGRSLTPSWREGPRGQLCIRPLAIMPERCATLRREGKAIVGVRDDGTPGMRLTRP